MLINEVGNRYGRLRVIERYDPTLHGGRWDKAANSALWFCKCDCGNTKIVRADALRKGYTTSCGCYRRESRKLIDETGNTYGRLKVVERYNPEKHGPYYCASTGALWFCECECGGTTIVQGASLRIGAVKSCGCWRRENTGRIGKSRAGKTWTRRPK